MDSIFSAQHLGAALLTCLLSVGLLVALFFYLNRYTQRHYFTIWAVAWLFYGLWLTLKLTTPNSADTSISSLCKLLCIETSAVFLLWGSFRFLDKETPQRLMGLFLVFLYVWSLVAPMIFSARLWIQSPCFLLMGVASITAGISFLAFRKHRHYVGAQLLSFGFVLWGLYLATHPFAEKDESRVNGAFFFSAIVQLFIAVSMIILVLEEVRHTHSLMAEEIESIKAEREVLHTKMRASEEQMRTLLGDSQLKEDLRRAYEELRTTHRAVVEQERLNVLGQLARGMAHEINNALTPVIGFSDFLLDHARNTPDVLRGTLQHIRNGARRIERIVGRIRDFYRDRAECDRFRSVNLNSLVTQVAEVTRSAWQAQPTVPGVTPTLETDLAEDLPEIEGEAEDLKEALEQLIANARDAMPQGGLIKITTRLANRPEHAPFTGELARIAVEVRDQGTGMDEATRRRCIEPFFSTKKPRCPGLGLSTVSGTMHRHRALLHIASEVGQGTAIRLEFPIARSPGQSSNQPGPSLEPLRVLCIDDEPLVRTLLQDMLQLHGHDVVLAEGGRAGIETFLKAQTSGQPFEVVFTDLGMPQVDGREVVQAIKHASPNTPIVLLTGWAALLDASDPLLEQVDAVLKKPLSLAELQDTLSQLIELSRHTSRNTDAGAMTAGARG